jgi:hypothetical protein
LRAPIAAMDSFYRDHLLVHDVGGDKTYRQFLLCSHDELTLARLTDFSVSLQTAQGLPNLTPLIDVLQAMQHIANHRPIQS